MPIFAFLIFIASLLCVIWSYMSGKDSAEKMTFRTFVFGVLAALAIIHIILSFITHEHIAVTIVFVLLYILCGAAGMYFDMTIYHSKAIKDIEELNEEYKSTKAFSKHLTTQATVRSKRLFDSDETIFVCYRAIEQNLDFFEHFDEYHKQALSDYNYYLNECRNIIHALKPPFREMKKRIATSYIHTSEPELSIVGTTRFVTLAGGEVFFKKDELEQDEIIQYMQERLYPDKHFYPLELLEGRLILPAFTGLYVIRNIDNDIFLVGQSDNVGKTVKDHFSGRGSQKLYQDFAAGKQFECFVFAFREGRFATLNEMEHFYTMLYNASVTGYNKSL